MAETLPRAFGRMGLDGGVLLDAEEEHHLLHVLRVRAGDELELADETGRLFLAEVEHASRRELRLRAVRELEADSYGAVRVRLAPAVLHPPAMERLVRLAAELHAARLSPVLTERSQHQAVSPKTLERWRRIAREACKQARRALVPPVDAPEPLARVLAEPSGPEVLRLGLVPRGAELDARALDALPEPAEVWLLQGPEGGWSQAELAALGRAGVRTLSLGRAVLRAETVPLVALALVHEHFGQLMRPPAEAGP
jgi:16S rRNA (uracil1498-N3)-methyltransferase